MDIDPSRVKLATARELIRLSELYIDGLMRFSIAADARASSLSGILASAATALITAGLTLVFADLLPTPISKALASSAFASSLLFYLALCFCISAARPRAFHVAGNYLQHWSTEEDLYNDLKTALVEQVKMYDEQIKENQHTLQKNADKINVALYFILATPFISLIVGVAVFDNG